jgi:hypothetical protein
MMQAPAIGKIVVAQVKLLIQHDATGVGVDGARNHGEYVGHVLVRRAATAPC